MWPDRLNNDVRARDPPIHSTNMSESTNSTTTLTKSLANDPRASLELRLEEIETQARNLRPQHDVTGALTLVVPDLVWNQNPADITNAAGVAVGDPPQYRARPKWDMPAAHDNAASASVIFIYRAEAVRHMDGLHQGQQ